MGISIHVVEWLRENKHDAKHLREEHLQRLPNGQIFEKAIREERWTRCPAARSCRILTIVDALGLGGESF
jgi:hypothetical protein